MSEIDEKCPPLRSSGSTEKAETIEDTTINLASTPETVLQGTVKEARELLDAHPKFFLAKCYPDLTLDIPDFHGELLEAMSNPAIQYLVCVCPRGFSKTMIARATAAKALMTNQSPFVVVINRNIKDATNSTREIWSIINSTFFQQVYGKVEPIIERDGLGEYEFMQNGQYKVLLARGRDSALQGMNVHNMRPNLIICDDIEQAKDKNEDIRYEDTKAWFFETMLFLMDEQNKRCVYIGNMNNKQSLIAELPSLTNWHSIILSAIKSDGTALWEERFPLEKLLAEFRQYCEIGMKKEWLAQKMSRVDDDAGGIIGADEIEYHSGLYPDDIEYGCITIDPAISDSSRADESVICVHGWANRAWNLVACRHGTGMDPIKLLHTAISLAMQYRIRLVCIEAIAYQKALIPLMDRELATRGLTGDIIVRPIASRASKASRIDAWISMLRNHVYRLARTDWAILDQLNTYVVGSKTCHDDRIDCCAMITMAAQSYRHLMRKSVGDPRLAMMQESSLNRTGFTGVDALRSEYRNASWSDNLSGPALSIPWNASRKGQGQG